jgi:dGTPase
MLMPYASRPEHSRGRRHAHLPDPARNEFQRDRDRIIHSTAFRRLVYKTQVFLNHEGDLFRTRLTHSLEVAQLGRSIARTLGLHEDLAEAISLAHDLGHAPFGHAGQEALDACLREAHPGGLGFEHNFQSLRVVDELEERYPDFDGLNLCFETREGILKHCSRTRAQWLEDREPAGVGRRFLDQTRPSLEAQVCNLADEIAYNAHDLDDGVRSGLITYEQILELAPCADFHRRALQAHPRLEGRRLLFEVIRRMISAQLRDLVETTGAALSHHEFQTSGEARFGPAVVGGSASAASDMHAIKAFLRVALYRHPRVVEQTEAAKQVVHDLYRAYVTDSTLLPAQHARRLPLEQAVADYIAGMTDRFAMREHAKLCSESPSG